ncbi:hypothetical protein ppKF707_3948 [Metapseudomonas furukawaii]|uniref:Uncharacterized protein n=1 Tax=Metapseudomonas furukawaii TaxID=1149133 RepID=A0AAD1C053_METFU|nr:hypothetical protein ppKF707_3948 [Pseudomonas furukawaii]BAU73732.1 hypothetical protein KF707C_20440 [Pseudomonas furukawaii]
MIVLVVYVHEMSCCQAAYSFSARTAAHSPRSRRKIPVQGYAQK